MVSVIIQYVMDVVFESALETDDFNAFNLFTCEIGSSIIRTKENSACDLSHPFPIGTIGYSGT